MNITNEEWKKLKVYIIDDLKASTEEEAACKKKGEEGKGWFMVAETERMILDEMKRLERAD